MLEQVAPFVALASGATALVVVGLTGLRAWRRWKQVSRTQEAAVALLDVHRERLDAAIELANERVGGVADGGEELAESLAELRADAKHLGWVVGRIPEERERLQRELLDLVLPTSTGRRDD